MLIFPKNFVKGYFFWDRLRNFLYKFTWIVLSDHKLNKLGKFWTIAEYYVKLWLIWKKFTTISWLLTCIFFAGIIYHAAMTWIKRVDHPQSGLQVEKISTRFNKMECTSGHRLWISNFLVILLAIAPSLAIGKWKNSNWP